MESLTLKNILVDLERKIIKKKKEKKVEVSLVFLFLFCTGVFV